MASVEILSSVRALHRLFPEWASLSSDAPRGNPFQSPIFALNWLEHFQGRSVLRVVVVREGNKLVGVAPRAAFAGRAPQSVGLADFTDALLLDRWVDAALSRGARPGA